MLCRRCVVHLFASIHLYISLSASCWQAMSFKHNQHTDPGSSLTSLLYCEDLASVSEQLLPCLFYSLNQSLNSIFNTDAHVCCVPGRMVLFLRLVTLRFCKSTRISSSTCSRISSKTIGRSSSLTSSWSHRCKKLSVSSRSCDAHAGPNICCTVHLSNICSTLRLTKGSHWRHKPSKEATQVAY